MELILGCKLFSIGGPFYLFILALVCLSITYFKLMELFQLTSEFYCSSNLMRSRRSKNSVQTASHVHPHVLESGLPEAALEGSREDYDNKDNGTCSSQRPHAYTTSASLTNGCDGTC